MITCKHLFKSFGQLAVLKDIDFTVNQGEVVSIVGASGAGKSTLLQIMGTLLIPDSGQVIIDGSDVFSMEGDALSDFRNRKIGFVFQFHHLQCCQDPLQPARLPARRTQHSPVL